MFGKVNTQGTHHGAADVQEALHPLVSDLSILGYAVTYASLTRISFSGFFARMRL